jgi:NitT/TauT family transport system ATP-binding protein
MRPVGVVLALRTSRTSCSTSATHVQEVLDVGLSRPRDQVDTKELPEFTRLRGHVWRSIKRPDAAPQEAGA